MIGPPRVIRFPLIVLISILCFIALFAYYDFPRTSISNGISWSSANLGRGIQPANATLGFGGIYVVSGPGSPRRDHLEQAAAVTELNLTIPEQTAWTEEDLAGFRVENASETKIGSGSVKAWLSHHLVLRAFLASGAETALIIENDVDWDIRLRTHAIPLTQRAARQLFSPRNQHEADEYPWGRPSTWDLLWVGACGDYFNPLDQGIGVGHHHPEQLKTIPHVVFEDTSVSYYTDLHPFTASLLTAFRIPERNRVLHASIFPLCTFGYAVTRGAAQRILNDVAPAREERMPNAHAFDVALLNGCRDRKIGCYSLQPELFHHMPGESVIGKVEGNQFLSPVDQKGMEQAWFRRETPNIDCGFFSGAFYYDGDMAKLEYLRKEVGRKGRCLKMGRDH